MQTWKLTLLAFAVVATAGTQSPDGLLSETRLTVHTLLREDIFAGFMNNQVDRLARAEQNIEVLLRERPGERGNLLAWRAGATLYRAVVAHESGRSEEFARYFSRAQEDFATAATLREGNSGVAAITGGSFAVFADRLPQDHRAAAWAQAYDAYALLWKEQGATIEELPVHFKGEVLAGLTQAAQRTGRTEEAAQHLDRMLVALSNTPYETTARQWKTDPARMATTSLTCKNCHNPGRLSAKVAALNK